VIEIRKNGLVCLQFPHLKRFDDLRHGIFTREGGCSREPFAGLNVGLSVGDSPGRVMQNRGMVAEFLEIQDLVFLRQVHGDKVYMHRPVSDAGDTRASGAVASADAAVTDTTHHALVVQVADCQAVLLYDPLKRVVANIHSGWRGSTRNVVGRTVHAMVSAFSCRAEHIHAGIGPSLGPCCAEFINYKDEIPRDYWGYKDKDNRFDLWSMTRDQLRDAGVGDGRIDTAGMCTKCSKDRFYSYRGEGQTGRFAACIGMV